MNLAVKYLCIIYLGGTRVFKYFGPKLQIRLMNLAVKISLHYLSRRHSCLQVLEMHRVRRINIALVILVLSHVLQVIYFCFARKRMEFKFKLLVFLALLHSDIIHKVRIF